MARASYVLGVLLLFTVLARLTPANAQTPDDPKSDRKRHEYTDRLAILRKRLAAPVKFSGVEDPDTELVDVLKYLERAYDIPFDINERAFEEEKVNDVLKQPIRKGIDKMNNVALSTVLGKVMERIPSKSGVTWIVRGYAVEITTKRAYHAEFYPRRPDGPFPPAVFTNFEKKPLEEALKQLAEETDTSIVVDVRVGEKAKTPVTARMSFVPLDTAILLLADMAELRPVVIDEVYYVTTRDNARTLREELGKDRPEKTKERKPAKPKPPKDR